MNDMKQHSKPRRGLSLLEVMIAMAILGLALAAIGELIRVGTESARMARKQTTAQLLCENKIAEIRAGIMLPLSIGPLPFDISETDQPWQYTIKTDQVNVEDMLMVEVTVEEISEAFRPYRYSLVMWMIDPDSIYLQPQLGGTGG